MSIVLCHFKGFSPSAQGSVLWAACLPPDEWATDMASLATVSSEMYQRHPASLRRSLLHAIAEAGQRGAIRIIQRSSKILGSSIRSMSGQMHLCQVVARGSRQRDTKARIANNLTAAKPSAPPQWLKRTCDVRRSSSPVQA